MSDFIVGSLCVAFGWVLFQGTEVWRARQLNNARLRLFWLDVLELMTQATLAEDESNEGNQPSPDALVNELPTIDSFREVSLFLSDEEAIYVMGQVIYWNMMRRTEPTVIPDTSGMKDLSQMVSCLMDLRKPFWTVFHREEAKKSRASLEALLNESQGVEGLRNGKNESAD